MYNLEDYMLALSKYVLIIISIVILVRCIRSLLSERVEPEIWGYLRYEGQDYPLTHWENLIGRSLSADVRIVAPGVSRSHAVLRRGGSGRWRVYNIFSRGGVWIKNQKAGASGLAVESGDTINLGGQKVRFRAVTPDKRQKQDLKRKRAGYGVSPAGTLLDLTIFQLTLLLQHAMSPRQKELQAVALAFVALIALEWSCYHFMRFMNRSGFEIETIAFYLTSIGMSVAASSVPGDMLKQILITILAVVLFAAMGWWLRDSNSETTEQATPDYGQQIKDNKTLGREFLEKNAQNDSVKQTKSGLQYMVIKEGNGIKPSATDTVTVHYTGTLIDGTVFDSSVERGEPASFPLDKVIPGWTEGLQLMSEGSKYRLFIPSELAYGSQGAGDQILPNSTLIFDVELIKVVKKK